MLKRLPVLSAVLALALAAAAYAQQPPVKIGAILPLTGSGASYGVCQVDRISRDARWRPRRKSPYTDDAADASGPRARSSRRVVESAGSVAGRLAGRRVAGRFGVV